MKLRSLLLKLERKGLSTVCGCCNPMKRKCLSSSLKTKVKDLKLKERKDRMSSDSPKLTLKSIRR